MPFQHGRHKFPLSDGLVSGLDAVIVRVKFLRHLGPELLENGSRGCIYIHLSYTFISFTQELLPFAVRPLDGLLLDESVQR